MAAPKGSQYALGHGRPPTYNLMEEAEALEKWSKLETSDFLQDFALERDTYPQRLYEWRDKCPYFKEVLKKAKARIASRIRKKVQLGTFNYGIYQREIGFWDELLNDYERAEKKFDAECKAKSLVQEQKNLSELAKMDFSQKEKSFQSDT